MEYLMLLLFLTDLICLLIGIIKPSMVIGWGDLKKSSRKNVLKYYGTGLIVTFILLCIFVPKTETKSNTSTMAKTQTVKNVEEQTETQQPKEIKKTGWIQKNGDWYYYSNNSKAKTGWIEDKNKYYYLNTSGIMQKGWVKDNGKDYYLDNSGVMQTGWKENNNKWYYLNEDGCMATNTIVDGCQLESNGEVKEKVVSVQPSTTDNDNVTNKGSNNTIAGNEQGQTVYITATGKKYHAISKCGKTKNSRAATLKEAQELGLDACSKCY